MITTSSSRLNAFYYDSSNIVYRTSDDMGHTWSSTISLGTGTVASDKHRWTVLSYTKDGQQHVNVVYWHVVGSNTNFYSKAGVVTWPSADISWDSPVLVDSTTVNSNCISASGSCVGVAAAADTDGNIYAAFKWVASGATYFSYKIKTSTDDGSTWTDSLPEVTGVSIYRPALTLTSLESNKMLFAYLKYDSADLYYRVFNGTSWSAVQTVTGTGMASNTYKQISSVSADGRPSAYVAYTNVTASAGGVLKIARFLSNGTYQTIETANSTLRHNLPSILSSPNGDLNILSISNGKVYDTRKRAGTWETPFTPFGTNFTSLDQLTGAVVMDGMLSGLWRESTGSPYNVRFGLLENGIITTSATVQNSPNSSDYYEGERRVFSSSGNVLFAFYYDGSNIRYKTSVDGGNTWSVASTSTGTGQLAYVAAYRWTIVHSFYNSTERVSVLYHNPDLNSHILFYAKTFVVNGTALSLNSTVLLDTVNSNAECFVEGETCNAVITGATDVNGTTLFAAYSWEDSINDSWYIAIKKSSNGGQTWLSSGGYTRLGYKIDPTPITMTQLDSGKMLMAFTTYQQNSMDYSIYDGSFWSSSPATITNIGWSNNTAKQISSVTVNPKIVNQTGMAYIAFLTGGYSGTLKVASFYGNGTYKGLEVADSTLVHHLPSLSVEGGRILHAYTLVNGVIYDTIRNETSWQSPFAPYGDDFVNPDQLTARVSEVSHSGVFFRTGSASPYTLRYAGGQSNVVAGSNSMLAPHASQSFEAEKRLVVTSSAQYAFYYDGSNIAYQYSQDSGYTWRIPTSQPQTGQLASYDYKWTVGATKIGSTNYIYLLYAKDSGNSIVFYAKRGTVSDTGTTISWSNPVALYTVQDGQNFGAVASADLSGSNVYAAFMWEDPLSSHFNYRIFKSSGGSTSWTNSTSSSTDSGSGYPLAMALTPLASGKMLFAYMEYDSSSLFYRVFDGTNWGTTSTYGSTGLPTSPTVKQVSAISDSTGKPYFAYTVAASGYDSSLRVVNWTSSGSSPVAKVIDTVARSGLGHRLPSMIVSSGDQVHIYFLSTSSVDSLNRRIYTISEVRNGTTPIGWSEPYSSYDLTGPADQLTVSINLNMSRTDALWTEGTSPYTIKSGGFLPWPVILICSRLQPATQANPCQDTASDSVHFGGIGFGYKTPEDKWIKQTCTPAPYTCQGVDFTFSYPRFTFWFEVTSIFPFRAEFQHEIISGEHMTHVFTTFSPPNDYVFSNVSAIPPCTESILGCTQIIEVNGIPDNSNVLHTLATRYRSESGHEVVILHYYWMPFGYATPPV
jgi:hypothetical protein